MKVKPLSRVWLFATPWTIAYQVPPSMGFSRQEYWSGLPFPSPGIFPTQGWNPGLLNCSVQFSPVTQSCLTLWDPMDCCTLGLPVHHQLLEFTQTHVHWVGDAIQPSHLLSSPSPPTLHLSQHQGLSKWVNSSHEVAKVLELRLSISPSNDYSGFIFFTIGYTKFKEPDFAHHLGKPSSSKLVSHLGR